MFSWHSFLSLTCATFRWIYHLSQMQQAMNRTSAGTHTDISSSERDSVEAAITDHQGQRDGPAKTPSAIMVQLAPSWYTMALSLSVSSVSALGLSHLLVSSRVPDGDHSGFLPIIMCPFCLTYLTVMKKKYISDVNCGISSLRSNKYISQHSWNEKYPHV